jgi:hypothetical protein
VTRIEAIAAEQAHLDRVHDRVEVLRERAESATAEVQGARLGSTFQARFERDVLAHHHASRAARLAVGDFEALVFGRLDSDDGASRAIGRLHVADEDGTVLLMDWRAPAASAFYRATAARPMGVARRRVIVTSARQVVDVEDELLDVEAADALGLAAVTGQGALLAVLGRERTPHLQDIAATIRGDQDRIIRTPAVGTLIVTGGPGTGKTVVALHRVAYLLYEQRERLAPRGVLVVGPSRAFTQYTSRVLPALGEDRVVQRPLAALGPRDVVADGWDEPRIATIKGDLRMVAVCRRLLAAALPAVPPSTRVVVRGTGVTVPGRTIARLRARMLDRVEADRDRATYHARTLGAQEALRELLWRRWVAAVEATGATPPEARADIDFDELLEDSPEVRMLWRCYWPATRAVDLLARVVAGEVRLAEVAAGLLAAEDLETLDANWEGTRGWTVDDVAVLDELDALLGPPPTQRVADDDGVGEVRVPPPQAEAGLTDPWYRDFGHVVVDEAQDLTPLQWRSIARRGAYATWTIVGDLHQRARRSEPADWDAVAALVGRSQVTVEHLDVNYRTPSELAPVAAAVLAAAGHDPAAFPRAVRSSGRPPLLVVTAEAAAAVEREVARLLADGNGTIAVLATPAVLAMLAPDGTTGRSAAVADAHGRVRRLDPRTAKGLEFDDVIVVDPGAIVASSEAGLHELYVAVTRPTRSLTVVTSEPGAMPGAEAFVVRDDRRGCR